MFAHRALLTACCARLVAAKLRHEPAHASEAPFDPPLPPPIPTQAMVTTTSTCIRPTSTTTGVAPILATLGTASGYDAKLQARCSPREFTHPAHAPSPCRAPHPLCAAQPVCAVPLRHSLLAVLSACLSCRCSSRRLGGSGASTGDDTAAARRAAARCTVARRTAARCAAEVWQLDVSSVLLTQAR